MLKITKGGETINNNNEKVATITLEDCTTWNLTEYMYVDWGELFNLIIIKIINKNYYYKQRTGRREINCFT